MSQAASIRQSFLDFYQKNGHAVLPSASLLPENDGSTLFTSSGMQPLVPYLLGEAHPQGVRICNSQKCFRAVDIEEVGDARHTTFFEMLGNWSLGDYFKKEQLPFIFEFLTDIVGLDPERLYVTVFQGDAKLKISQDDEAIKIWQELFAKKGIIAKINERIFAYDANKNWWSRSGTPDKMPIGEPGGTDSEIFYDFGEISKTHQKSQWRNEQCHPNCDCGRFIEIGNSVFMEFQKTEDGNFIELSQKNVDYGGGLERLLMAKENQEDIFLTSLFSPLVQSLTKKLNWNYQDLQEEQKKAIRIITDHIRSAIMLLDEGVQPNNKEQGYVLRRLIRKSLAVAEGIKLQSEILLELVPQMAEIYQEAFPSLRKNQVEIQNQLKKEIQKFQQTLKNGLKEINKLTEIDGEKAFFLYETYGFPFELTQEIVTAKNLKFSAIDFYEAKKRHQEVSKMKSATKFKGGLADNEIQTVKFHTASHLLLTAIRKHFKADAQQKGSNITGERARLDFTLDKALTLEDTQLLENQVNEWIEADLKITKTLHEKQEALEIVGGSVFAERYPDTVSIFNIEGVSKEICVGPHVGRTGEIKKVKIQKQQGVSTGVRRIYLKMAE